MGFMFADADSGPITGTSTGARVGEVYDMTKTVPKDPVEAALHDIRETIQILFMMAFSKVSAAVLHAADKLRVRYHMKAHLCWEDPRTLVVSSCDKADAAVSRPPPCKALALHIGARIMF